MNNRNVIVFKDEERAGFFKVIFQPDFEESHLGDEIKTASVPEVILKLHLTDWIVQWVERGEFPFI